MSFSGLLNPLSGGPRTVSSISNAAWIVYGFSLGDIYAQPKSVPYPLFVSIKISLGTMFRPRITTVDPDRHNFNFGRVVDCERGPTPKARKLAIILHILTTWSHGFANLQRVYGALPFYSVISIQDHGTGTDTFNCDIPFGSGDKSRIVNVTFNVTIVANHKFESQVRTFVVLRNLWGITAGLSKNPPGALHTNTHRIMPPVIPATSLTLKGWLQDTVNLVSIPSSKNPGALYAFKTNGRAYRLYQEIETLLNLPPHENIHRPSYLITKETLYSLHNPLDPASRNISEPSEPIIGFLTPFHPLGSLRNVINSRHAAKTLSIDDQLKWARQLVSAVIHVFKHENGSDKTRCGIYTNLKMSNIMVTSPEEGSNLVLIDFERSFGNNWSHYSAPEIDCRMPLYKGNYEDRKKKMPSSNILGRPNSIHEYISSPEDYLDENNFWTNASNAERESAMVWALGCCLWCIFEAKGCMVDVISQSVPFTRDCEWPTVTFGCPWDQAVKLYNIPHAVLHIVTMCIKKETEDRPTLKEISDVLEKWRKRLILDVEPEETSLSSKRRRIDPSLEKEMEIKIEDKRPEVLMGDIIDRFNSGGVRKKRKITLKEVNNSTEGLE
ncbi:hypothetical protein Q9L58_003887 [Maublancomyces gigas]|uniref:Protein kinase domain-containing protein n=1 Tax=Discina gigas TaxID=1032678 RepID=A0ABR3GME2_9PEZI